MGPGSNLAGAVLYGRCPIRRSSIRGLRLPGEIPGESPTSVGFSFVGRRARGGGISADWPRQRPGFSVQPPGSGGGGGGGGGGWVVVGEKLSHV